MESIAPRCILSPGADICGSPEHACCTPTYGILMLVFVWMKGAAISQNHTESNKNYGKFRPAQELPNVWTIHGLWPNYCDKRGYPEPKKVGNMHSNSLFSSVKDKVIQKKKLQDGSRGIKSCTVI